MRILLEPCKELAEPRLKSTGEERWKGKREREEKRFGREERKMVEMGWRGGVHIFREGEIEREMGVSGRGRILAQK